VSTVGRLVEAPDPPSVLVVDNASDDATVAETRRRHPSVKVVSLPGNAGAAARNIGARLATTALVAFSDDDSWWDPGALALAADILEADPAIALAAARVLVGVDGEIDPISVLMAAGALDEWHRPAPAGRRGVTGFLACAAVVRRRAFLAVGGFEPHLLIGGEEEPVALALADAGWKLVYTPDVVARHHPSSRRETDRRRRLLVRNDLLTTWRHYPVAVAARRSLKRIATIDVTLWPAVAAAARSAPWVAAHRRAVSPRVVAAFTAADGPHET
jgi:GT2 family glycosyltransferase